MLTFEPTITVDGATSIRYNMSQKVVFAKQVILAIPVFALKQLDWPPLNTSKARQVYHAVEPMIASKVHMTFSQPWWKNNSSRKATVTKGDGVYQQFYDMTDDYIPNSNVSLAMVSYTHGNNSKLLMSLNEQGRVVYGSRPGVHKVTRRLKDKLLHELAEVYGVEHIPHPLSSMAQWWTDFSFGGGWITWRKGYVIDDVMAVMRKPSLTDEVYVVGSDYSWGTRALWQEGALETAHGVLRDYFGLKEHPPKTGA